MAVPELSQNHLLGPEGSRFLGYPSQRPFGPFFIVTFRASLELWKAVDVDRHPSVENSESITQLWDGVLDLSVHQEDEGLVDLIHENRLPFIINRNRTIAHPELYVQDRQGPLHGFEQVEEYLKDYLDRREEGGK